MMDLKRFERKPVLGILRGVEADVIDPLAETIVSSGLETVEITMNTADAPGLIRRMARISEKRLTVGAGTVVDMASLKAALGAGASFIVMPVLIDDVMRHCVRNKIPAFPGALTPLEVHNAWKAGATMVKVFPSGFFGPAYFRELKGPFSDIRMLACGGVTPENMKEYFASGASAVAFGASVFRKEWLAKREFAKIGESIKRYLKEDLWR